MKTAALAADVDRHPVLVNFREREAVVEVRRVAPPAVQVKVLLLVVRKAPRRNVGHVVQFLCRSTSTGFNNESFQFRVFLNVNIQTCKPALKALCFISKPVAVDKVVDQAVLVAAMN